ncbi:MAG TPA: hypothetical protein VN889_00885 [Solirubrobacteraceae bacterium]|nr:hypothetical protein [Solirubrobacteraceae bacterium]
MERSEQLTVKQASSNYWVVRSDGEQIAGAVTRQAAEAERELVSRLRRRAAQMRSSAPRRARAVRQPSR